MSNVQQQQLPASSASPPLPNLHSLSISPYPGGSTGDYRYNGVFGPPVPGHNPGWSSPTNKRGSRSGLPTAGDSQNPTPSFEPYRNQSPPALSPPSSTTSGPTTNSSHHYPYPGSAYQHISDQPIGFSSMAVSPSPPPIIGYGGIPATGPGGPNLGGFNPAGMPQYGSQPLSGLQNRNSNNGMWNRSTYAGVPMPDDDVIPTAIVIKNIPFAVPREQLLGVIESLGAPLPYAFNYHHDNGIFRGLAFANFRAPDEAASVVAALNGYDVQGRKLRVEYKKVLQPGEKDKIEREKALKRMRSIQFDPSPPVPAGQREMAMPPPLNIPPQHSNLHPGSRPGSTPSAIPTPVSNGHLSADQEHSPPHSASSATSETLPVNLDLNDPMALDIYSRVLVFKEDRMRDELAFSRSLTPTERRIVHLVAQKLGLTSITKGNEGEVKYVVVTREAAPRPSLNTSNSTTSSSYLSPYGTTSTELSPSLRIKKSMPDLRGFNGPVVARDPARSLTPQRSSGNLRGENGGSSREYVSMGASAGRRANGMGSGTFNNFFGSPIDSVPPVPPIPAGLGLHATRGSMSNLNAVGGNPGASGPSAENSDPSGAAPTRNPRGPAGDNSRGFGAPGNGNASGNGGLRGSASGVNLRGSGSSNSGAMGSSLGRRMTEEGDAEDMLGPLRTRESLDI
ncbi:hypothetical protein DB88DRAFT_503651 [Papiliotrema laurentii]|uniref:Uncharacterized protein n=1 Tax=Papiliotrema laurentii TaxID=5418 RepID=A0AAD9CSD1_PAPLA|nr:hypothetical protein DB88DRAFT_503651 [Papiliotrema laurentii]